MRITDIFQMFMGWGINGLDDDKYHFGGVRSWGGRLEGTSAKERGLAICREG